jgi:hypothetical protein
MLFFTIMKYLKKLLVIASLVSTVGSCYVQTRGPRYARHDCAPGRYWNGHHCHRNW